MAGTSLGALLNSMEADKVTLAQFVEKVVPRIEGCLGDFEYQGFDIDGVKAKFEAMFGEATHKHAQTLLVVGTCVITRGTDLAKIMKKSKTELRDALSWMRSIFTQNRGTTLEPKDITPSRLCACYPDKIAHLASKVGRSKVPALEAITGIFASNCLAPVMPSDTGDFYDNLKRINLAYLIEFDRIINPRKRPDPDQIVNYFGVAMRNPLLEQSGRTKVLKDIKIVQTYQQIMGNAVLVAAINSVPVPGMTTLKSNAVIPAVLTEAASTAS